MTKNFSYWRYRDFYINRHIEISLAIQKSHQLALFAFFSLLQGIGDIFNTLKTDKHTHTGAHIQILASVLCLYY